MAASTSQMASVSRTPVQLWGVRQISRVLPAPAPRRVVVRAQAGKANAELQSQVTKVLALSTVAGSFLAAGNAQAATEIATLAAGDNRFGIIATLFLPVLGWVAYNIGEPLRNQLATKKAVAVGLGLTAATLLATQSADAAELVADVAAGDNRFGIILTLFLPVLGWVAFNIGEPLRNQLASKKVVAAGLGLTAASLLTTQSADAAELVADVAAGDGRFGIILTLFLPVLGWVAYNIGEPLLNQLATKKAVAAGLGLTAAALLTTESADAAELVADLAAGDNRFGIILTLFLPVIGWVLFNIGGPALNQLNETASKQSRGKKK